MTRCVLATRFWLGLLVGFLALVGEGLAAPPRVTDQGTLPADARLNPPRTTNDKYHPWVPATTREGWEAQKETIRERMLVSLGLWPMPSAAPLKAVVHGRIEREDYVIDKVFFAGYPGFYITGNLYRPKNVTGKVPGVLCPHGHWRNGRFYELANEKAQQEQLDKGAEKFPNGAKYPLQARMVGLARMGCIVFHYDMVGNADSQQTGHSEGFTDLEANLRLQSFMGLQSFNSMRALDFLLSLPEVDSQRIGVTGASGGGTQTFVLCALDPRPTAAFPAVMVSTAMQGGCVCENCSYLRIGINNVAMTALFAPKPLAMSAADDWTIDIETKGLPELKQIYGLYGKGDLVHAKTYREFGHNYNQVAREMMYRWFNQHLGLSGPTEEREFTPVPPAELSVYDTDHPRPADAVTAAELKAYQTRISNEQYAALLPQDAAGVKEYRRVVGTAARVLLDGGLPSSDDVVGATQLVETPLDDVRLYRVAATRRGAGEQIPVVGLVPGNFNGTAVVWIDGAGKSHLFGDDGKPTAAVRKLLTAGQAVISADVLQTGEYLADGAAPVTTQAVDKNYVGYTFGYNRPLLANRVRDVLTVLAGVKRYPNFRTIHLVGTGAAGPWVLLARSVAGDTVQRCVVDLGGFGFGKLQSNDDAAMLPGGLKYGGLGGLAALAAPADLQLFGTTGTPQDELDPLKAVYKAAGGKLDLQEAALTDENVVERLLK